MFFWNNIVNVSLPTATLIGFINDSSLMLRLHYGTNSGQLEIVIKKINACCNYDFHFLEPDPRMAKMEEQEKKRLPFFAAKMSTRGPQFESHLYGNPVHPQSSSEARGVQQLQLVSQLFYVTTFPHPRSRFCLTFITKHSSL